MKPHGRWVFQTFASRGKQPRRPESGIEVKREAGPAPEPFHLVPRTPRPLVKLDLEEAEETAKEDVIAQREEALQRELEEAKRRTRKLVDPLQYEFSIDAEDLINYEPVMMWEMLPPSEKQLQTLEKFGIFPDDVTTAGFASKLIDRLIKRSKAGLATPKQIRLLEKKGFQKVGSWQFSDANSMIGRISANGWRIPDYIIPELYDPRRN